VLFVNKKHEKIILTVEKCSALKPSNAKHGFYENIPVESGTFHI
jgi:hypothetical protein